MYRPPSRPCLLVILLLAVLFSSRTALAQIPDKFTNLKVLPKKITKDELVGTMRNFAGSLGVRCAFCHAGGNPDNLEGTNFASDEKKEKRAARAMMLMVKEINGKLIPKAGIENPTRVECMTCHHGLANPETIQDVMEREIGKNGLEGAKTTYLALKEKYYGKAAYDFSSGPLNMVSEWLANDKNDSDTAIALMRFNIEQYPGIAYSYNLLGRIQAGKGDNEAAKASLRKALELDPGDKSSARILDKLEAGK